MNSTQNNEPLNNNILNFYSNSRKDVFNNLLTFYTVENQDIMRIIQNIKTKAFGSDQLNITLIVLCCPFVVEYITHIINQCISTSHFPIGWKEAVVTPLPKLSNPQEVGQFRSIGDSRVQTPFWSFPPPLFYDLDLETTLSNLDIDFEMTLSNHDFEMTLAVDIDLEMTLNDLG